MFTELAVIDWIALAFAAVLLAAACAAAIIAYATSSNRQGPLPSMVKGLARSQTSRHAAPKQSPRNHVRSTTGGAGPEAAIDLREATVGEQGPPGHGMAEAEVPEAPEPPSTVVAEIDDPDRRLAERAARLRGRPIPEERPSVESESLSHKALVQSVVANRIPAHAKTSGSTVLETGVSSSNYDRVDGFKARTPGFFDDPMGRHELRYWDGHAWTEYVKEHGERFTDPL